MKHLFAFLSLTPFFLTVVLAQPKFELGLTSEASWVMKKELTDPGFHIGERHNWGTALGAYVSVPVWWHFSVSSGVSYRYSEIQNGRAIWTPYGEGQSAILTGYDYRKYRRYYLVVPFNLNILLLRNWLISGGIEYCRVLDDIYYIRNNPEYNWSIGIGSQKHKLRWSLQYLRGFKEQRMQNKGNNPFLYNYQTNRLQLNLSYPLWKSK